MSDPTEPVPPPSEPRPPRMHPSTVLAVAPTDSVAPLWWPVYEVRRHFAPTRIILTDDPPAFLER